MIDAEAMLADIRQRTLAQRGRWEELAKLSGLSWNVIRRLAHDRVQNPSIHQLAALDRGLREMEGLG